MITISEVKEKTPKRFWSKIKFGEPNECWEWQKALSHGYGVFKVTYDIGVSKKRLSHRLLYEYLFGEIGSRDLFVCHDCDNPKCCNPNHFFLGTDGDNVRDMIKKGRKVILKGESHGRAILTENDVVEIKKMIAAKNATVVAISKMYSVARRTIREIKDGRNWKHVKIS